jgi:hypothetical protein
MQSIESQMTFQKNMLPPYSEQRIHSACYVFHAGLLLDLFFDPEVVNNMFLQNITWLSTSYMAL